MNARYENLKIRKDGNIAVVEFNRPAKANALNLMWKGLPLITHIAGPARNLLRDRRHAAHTGGCRSCHSVACS